MISVVGCCHCSFYHKMVDLDNPPSTLLLANIRTASDQALNTKPVLDFTEQFKRTRMKFSFILASGTSFTVRAAAPSLMTGGSQETMFKTKSLMFGLFRAAAFTSHCSGMAPARVNTHKGPRVQGEVLLYFYRSICKRL